MAGGIIPTEAAWEKIRRTVELIEQRFGRLDRFMHRPRPRGGGGGSSALQLVFIEEFEEFIACKSWDGETVGDTVINVAKQYSLRVSSWKDRELDGVTYSQIGAAVNRRSGDDGTTTQVERIIPRYGLYGNAVEIVYAIRPIGGTSVKDEFDVPILLVEISGGHVWGKERPQ